MNIIFEHLWLNEEVRVEITKHGEERSQTRDDKPVNISRNQIEDIVKKGFGKLKDYLSRFKTFVLHDVKSGINLVMRVIRKGSDFVVKIITVMKKKGFKPYPEDKYIEVYENISIYERNTGYMTYKQYYQIND